MQAKLGKLNTPKCWHLPPLKHGDNKYTRGHVLLLGGARMTGAARLAALAAQRAGAGMVTLAAPRDAWPIYAASMMSVITTPLDSMNDWRDLLHKRHVNAVLLGPGCEPVSALEEALLHAGASKLPLVLDAGALTLLAQHPKLLASIHAPYICLPHEGEFAKLADAFGVKSAADKATRAAALAKKLGAVVLLKGAETIIAAPQGKIRRNRAKAPWLATAGSGDVLAGIVVGLVAQGMEPFDATAAGAYIHTQAAMKFGRGMLAEDLLEAIPTVLRKLDA